MALPTFTTRQTALSDDMTSLVSHLTGGVGKTEAWHFRVATSNNLLITLADAAGVSKVSVRDSTGAEVWSVNSLGATTGGALTPTSLILPTSAAPSQTTEGSVAWDTDDDVLTVGTGAATKRLGLTRGAGSSATAQNEIVYDTTLGALKVWDGTTSKTVAPTFKYATATQTVSASSAFVDVITSGASTAKFTMAANEVWICEYCVPLTFTGTGGVKFQWTGPAAPTAVYGQAWYTANRAQANDGGSNSEQPVSVYMQATAVSAFSSALLSKNINGADSDIQSTAAQEIRLRLWVRNGANAGDVTLQFAQNSANGTTVIGAAGFLMTAERIA